MGLRNMYPEDALSLSKQILKKLIKGFNNTNIFEHPQKQQILDNFFHQASKQMTLKTFVFEKGSDRVGILNYAVLNGQLELVEQLLPWALKNKVNGNFSEGMLQAFCGNSNQNNNNLLMICLRSGNIELAKYLLNSGLGNYYDFFASDWEGNTPLHHAVIENNFDFLETILDFFRERDLDPKTLNVLNKQKQNALSLLCDSKVEVKGKIENFSQRRINLIIKMVMAGSILMTNLDDIFDASQQLDLPYTLLTKNTKEFINYFIVELAKEKDKCLDGNQYSRLDECAEIIKKYLLIFKYALSEQKRLASFKFYSLSTLLTEQSLVLNDQDKVLSETINIELDVDRLLGSQTGFVKSKVVEDKVYLSCGLILLCYVAIMVALGVKKAEYSPAYKACQAQDKWGQCYSKSEEINAFRRYDYALLGVGLFGATVAGIIIGVILCVDSSLNGPFFGRSSYSYQNWQHILKNIENFLLNPLLNLKHPNKNLQKLLLNLKDLCSDFDRDLKEAEFKAGFKKIKEAITALRLAILKEDNLFGLLNADDLSDDDQTRRELLTNSR